MEEFYKAFIHGRPTQPPLNTEQQKQKIEELKQSYWPTPPPVPSLPIAPIKETKLSEEAQLNAVQVQFKQRGMQQQVQTVEKELEEKKTTATIKQFYCNHRFTPVRANYMGLTLQYKICNKCGLVK